MNALLRTDDLISIILQYLNPNGRDIVHFKLVSSYCKELVEKVVPLHHIISIFQSILNNDQTIPPLVLPSNFILDPICFKVYFRKQEQTFQKEHLSYHLITKFILLFHEHPTCIQFLQLSHNTVFLLQLAKVNYSPQSPLFQQLRSINRLKTILDQSTISNPDTSYMRDVYIVNKSWIEEKEWNAAIFTPHCMYKGLMKCVTFPNEKEWVNDIIENKELLLFMIKRCNSDSACYLANCLLMHCKWQEYKEDKRFHSSLLSLHSIQQKIVEEVSLSKCQDVTYLKELLRYKGYLIQYLSPEMRKNKSVVMTAVKSYSNAYQYVDKELQMDKAIVRINCSTTYCDDVDRKDAILKYFENDEEFLKELALLNTEWVCKKHFWSANKEEALHAVTKNSTIFSLYLHKYWSKDRDVVLAAVKSNGLNLENASDELKHDKEIVMTALQQNSRAVHCIPHRKGDRDLLLSVLKYDGFAFQYFNKKFNNDKEIIVESVKTCSIAFKRASAFIREDYDCVKQILQANGCCYRYLTPQLREKEELIHIAVQSNPMVLKELPQEMQTKSEIMQLAKHFYGVGDVNYDQKQPFKKQKS